MNQEIDRLIDRADAQVAENVTGIDTFSQALITGLLAALRSLRQENERLREPSESQLAKAEGVLNVAMVLLHGEHPSVAYTEEGYHVWLRGVVSQIAAALGEEES